KFQNQACCDGAIIVGGAYNYKSNYTPSDGDGAKAGGAVASNTFMAWAPKIDMGANVGTIAKDLDPYFTPSGQDLCVYKLNYKSSGSTNGKLNWNIAVNNCASGKSADGDPDGGWYLPNMREFFAIYWALGNSSTSTTPGKKVSFSGLTAPNSVETTAEDLVVGRWWTSSQSTSSGKNYYIVDTSNNNNRDRREYTDQGFSRCVKRL
ncbi:MAG: hypothetical protein LBO74_07635, partial [Candidatus Symbiothrix sp.]|nr:hypothetical protein [Candidatus Symbiothrix sp.]